MIYTTRASRGNHSHALSAALALAKLAGWSFVGRPELLPPPLAGALYGWSAACCCGRRIC